MAEKKTVLKTEYNDNSIMQLSDLQAVREHPNVYLGTSGIEGCQQAVFEILSNSVDEAREGYGDKITVTLFKDGSVEVDDRGRGVPLGYNERLGKYNWELVFCKLNAGGKYNKNSGNGAYEFSLGTHGIGACATQFTSEFMTVKSYRNGICSEISFKKGVVDSAYTEREITDRKEMRSGTVIRWKPDIDVFTDIALDDLYFKQILRRQAVVNPGLKFIFKKETSKGSFERFEYLYENGIVDYVKEIGGEKSVTDIVNWKKETAGRDREDKEEYKLKMEIAFCCNPEISAVEYYHNSSYLLHGGSPDKAVRAAFVSCFDKYIKNTGKYKKDENKITFADIQECLILVTNCFSTAGAFEHQTKSAINNAFIQSAMTEWIKSNLEIYFGERPKEADIFVENMLANKRSRENAGQERLELKKKLLKTTDTSSKVEKFAPCRSKDKNLREVYIVEGDSAMTSCKLAREPEYQAIMPVRGKTLNCLKSSYDKILSSEIITDLIRVVGCGIEIKHKQMKDLQNFSLDNLKWNKIIICTDADEDGFQIRTLLLTMFYRLLPTLIEIGKVYIAESPLYEITTKDETFFAYDEREKEKILSGLKNKKYTLQRSKGLGENEPDMMWKTTMNPETRRLIRVTPTDAEKTAMMFDILLGDDSQARKQFIFENGERYFDFADV